MHVHVHMYTLACNLHDSLYKHVHVFCICVVSVCMRCAYTHACVCNVLVYKHVHACFRMFICACVYTSLVGLCMCNHVYIRSCITICLCVLLLCMCKLCAKANPLPRLHTLMLYPRICMCIHPSHVHVFD